MVNKNLVFRTCRSYISTYHVRPSSSQPWVVALWCNLRKRRDPCVVTTNRTFSSQNDSHNHNSSSTFALPFSISPDQGVDKFRRWAIEEQGLNYLMNWNALRIGAAYCPVWSFDLNIRFVCKDGDKTWKPEMFTAYGNEPVIFLPGLSSYAGYNYRRSLVHPVHSTTLVFRHQDLVPFGGWMLRDMKLSNGYTLSITPDPWNAPRGRALALLKSELQLMTQTERQDVDVQIQVVSSKRVYMPIYFIDYKLWVGTEYRAFVSGCDGGAHVSGVSHQLLNVSQDEWQKASSTLMSGAFSATKTGLQLALRNRQIATAFIIALQYVGMFVARVLVRIPVIGLAAGLFVGFRKVVQPWYNNQVATAAWERQRELDASERVTKGNDFEDLSGSAEQFFQQNRTRILRHLSGDNEEHQRGNFDWYTEWEQWARQQWEQQQQQYGYGEQQQQQQQRGSRYRQTKKQEYQWDFDPNDPYVNNYDLILLERMSCY